MSSHKNCIISGKNKVVTLIHRFSIVFCSGLFQILYLTVLNLLFYRLGDKMNVDTSMFRRAVWNYIHCMYGIRHDDYNYAEVNSMLERSLKAYIKTVTCYPERLTKKDYDSVMKEFKHSEKVKQAPGLEGLNLKQFYLFLYSIAHELFHIHP